MLNTESNLVRKITLSLNGIEIAPAQLEELRVNWGIYKFKITGFFQFVDATGLLSNLHIKGGDPISLYIMDYDYNIFKQDFVVTEVNSIRGIRYTTVRIDFVDSLTITMMKMYKHMSWKEADAIQIIDHNETIKPALDNKIKDFERGLTKFKNFVMPLNSSFNVVTHWLSEHSNCLWYQTRTHYVFRPIKELVNRPKKGDIFYLKPDNEHYRRYIYKYRISNGKYLETLSYAPNITTNKFKNDGMIYEDNDNSNTKSSQEIKGPSKMGTKLADNPSTDERYNYKSPINNKDKLDFYSEQHSLKNVTIDIQVPGQSITNVGDVVEIELVEELKYMFPDKTSTGYWLILGIEDIYKDGHFIQNITLGRSTYFKE